MTSSPDDSVFRAAVDCDDCVVHHGAPINLPLTGRSFAHAKLYSATPPLQRIVALDETGAIVDADALLAAEGAAVDRRQGKLRNELFAISQTSSTKPVPVWIWADVREAPHIPRHRLVQLHDLI